MRVSILIPCFNGELTVARAVRSALAQTYADKEVIVVDDGSTDASPRVLATFGDQIRFERQANAGGGPTRNRLLDLSRGEWLQYLDSDDYLMPDKIAGQRAFLEGRPDVDVAYGPILLQPGNRSPELLPIPPPHDPWVLLARWWLPQTGAPLWRKSAIQDVGGWKADQQRCQEHELYLRLLAAGKVFAYCDVSGAVYCQRTGGSVSTENPAATRRYRLEITSAIERHLAVLDLLTPERLAAIQQSRFELARIAWHSDRDEARALVASIEQKTPGFIPSGAAFPSMYRWLYSLFGFGFAETLADWRRALWPSRGISK